MDFVPDFLLHRPPRTRWNTDADDGCGGSGSLDFYPALSMGTVIKIKCALPTLDTGGTSYLPPGTMESTTRMHTTENELYSGTVADFSGSDPIIYREPLQTEQYDSLSLNGEYTGSGYPTLSHWVEIKSWWIFCILIRPQIVVVQSFMLQLLLYLPIGRSS